MLVYRRVWLLNFDHSASRQLDTTAGVDFPHHVEMTFTEKPWFFHIYFSLLGTSPSLSLNL